MDKSKDNLDDDNKMEKYESNFDYDPQKYCRFCDGNLHGIRHLVECRRNRKEESENDTEIAINDNELLRRPLELGVSKVENKRDKTVENETKEKDTKVERYVDVSISEESDKVDDVESEIEEKNHETLAEKVSKLENEGDEMSDIVKEVEKAEKLMALIRDLENRDLSDQDRVTLKFAQEKLIERANQIKDLVKKREVAKNETAENDLKMEESEKDDDKESGSGFNTKVIQCEEVNKTVGESVKDFIKKREDVVKNETKENNTKVEESDTIFVNFKVNFIENFI